MKKILIIIMIIGILSIGAVSFAYGFDKNDIDKSSYSRMVDLMEENGFPECRTSLYMSLISQYIFKINKGQP